MIALVTAVLLVAFDQVSKLLCDIWLKSRQSIAIIPEVLNFTYVENRGAAFGMLTEHRWIFMVLSVIVIAVIAVLIVKFRKSHRLLCVSLGLLLGGGVGNMIDRIRLGYVIDFIDFRVFDFWKWVFNIADCGVTVGCALLIIYLLFFDGKNSVKTENKHND